MTMPSRRETAILRQQDETGITEDMIHDLVHTFYAGIRRDPLLGPIFEARIDDWDTHLATMCDFWSSVALTSGRYHGRPMPKHISLPVGPEHFTRWLELFGNAADQVCTPDAAEFFRDRARRVATSFQYAMGIAQPAER